MHGWERHGVVWAIDSFPAPCDFPQFTGCQGFPSCQWWQIPILWFPAVLRNSQAIKMVKILVPNSSPGFPNCPDGDINPFPGCPVFSDSQSVIRRRWNAVTLKQSDLRPQKLENQWLGHQMFTLVWLNLVLLFNCYCTCHCSWWFQMTSALLCVVLWLSPPCWFWTDCINSCLVLTLDPAFWLCKLCLMLNPACW